MASSYVVRPFFGYCLKEDFSGRCYLFCSHVLKIYKKYTMKTSSGKKEYHRVQLNIQLIIFNCFSKRTALSIIVWFCKASLRYRLQNVIEKLF